jgi:hypothetical protein
MAPIGSCKLPPAESRQSRLAVSRFLSQCLTYFLVSSGVPAYWMFQNRAWRHDSLLGGWRGLLSGQRPGKKSARERPAATCPCLMSPFLCTARRSIRSPAPSRGLRPAVFFLTRVYVYILEPKSVWVRHVIFMRTARHIYAFEIKLVELYDGAIPNDLISMVDVQ